MSNQDGFSRITICGVTAVSLSCLLCTSRGNDDNATLGKLGFWREFVCSENKYNCRAAVEAVLICRIRDDGVNVAKAFNLLYRFPSGVLLYLIFERFGNCGLRSKIDRFVEGEVTEVGERELYVMQVT